jgi:ketosteroid isomerase-like protein
VTEQALAATVRELADKEAIRDLACRYAHHVWRQDADAVAELFADDGEMDTSLEEPIRGRTAIRSALARLLDGADLQPFVHNHLIEVDGDRASGICYIDLRSVRDGKSMIGAGFYTDRYQRVGGQWKFSSRALTLRHFVPLEDGWTPKPD